MGIIWCLLDGVCQHGTEHQVQGFGSQPGMLCFLSAWTSAGVQADREDLPTCSTPSIAMICYVSCAVIITRT